ncbi:MAG TPA: ADP-ribosylglycohydrolase family protein [Chitinophagaceae bacterium]|nr:ADP-ribosylglycohydrolase family protein [Chitinophagaceae bacterium]
MNTIQVQKIKGVFYGQAIGDALGLGTEFLNKKTIQEYYPNGLNEYAQIVQDKHRERWKIGDWTDDTDQFLCICDGILKNNSANPQAFVVELYKWFKGNPMGIGQSTLKLLSLPEYTKKPFQASKFAWELSRRQNAPNGGIMRASILGTYNFNNIDAVIKNTEENIKTTHWDPRCVGSAVILNYIIAHLIQNDRVVSIEEIIEIGKRYDSRIEEYILMAKNDDISLLKLEEVKSMGYTLKALAAGLWAFFHAENFEEGILKIIHEGGDADTNACVAGSILGAKFGINNIPKNWQDSLYRKSFLDKKLEEYLKLTLK